MELKQTETPWQVASTAEGYATLLVKDDRIIARFGSSDFLQAERDAAFAARAVNCHKELITFAKVLREYMVVNRNEINEEMLEHLETVLARAEGK